MLINFNLMAIRNSLTETRLRVRYAETDQMGVAYHSNYLVWFEVARVEFFRQFGLSYERLERESGIFLPVVEVYCRYLKPLQYDHEFLIWTQLKQKGRRCLTFAYQVVNVTGDLQYARGTTKHVPTNRQGRICSFPSEFYLVLELAIRQE